MTAAEEACVYIMGRILRDGQVAYLLGPGSEAYRKITDAVAATRGMTGDDYRAEVLPHIQTEAVVPRWMYEQAQAESTTP